MTLWESGESTGDVSLSELFSNPQKPVRGRNTLSLADIAFITCRGGWPKAINKSHANAALTHAKNYFEAIVRTDMSRVDNIDRNEERVRRIMRSYARLQGSQASVRTILNDISENDTADISDKTVYSYINALKSIFVVEDMPAWNPNLRSKTAIRNSNTRYFVDPSVACAALGMGPNDLIGDLNTFGLFFETLCVRDIRVYAQAIDGNVFHFRDKNGLECDAVVHLRNGSYGLIEIKLGGDKLINEGAANLLKLSQNINTDKMKTPSFMMVLTAVGDMAYRRTDGVIVVPFACLKD
jgi:hypothetical protein